MDSLITAAASALAAGDPLGALRRVALRDDAPSLALRGIAMAQLGDFSRARTLVQRAARAFGPREVVARARCTVAAAEIALASRDLAQAGAALAAARATLERHGDLANAAHAAYLQIRRDVLIGRTDEAASALAELDAGRQPMPLQAVHALVDMGIAVRRMDTAAARAALSRARTAARAAGIPTLAAEVERASLLLETPAARLISSAEQRMLLLQDVEALLASDTLVVDARHHAVRRGAVLVDLIRRPVLFALVRTLAEAWPDDASREALLTKAFGARHADESHRARLRVEMGRLRRLLRSVAVFRATPGGFAMAPTRARRVAVLTPAVEDEHAAVLACLADGESWSSSALALTLGTSQRTVQRALDALSSTGRAQAFGRGRSRRWMAPPPPGITTPLLLPASLPVG
jgi:hypothetical protein